MTIDLYYLPISPPTRAVMMLARAVGVHLNLKTVDITKGEQLKPEYIKVNPQHTIPTIDDNGFILCESRAIMGYLVNRYAKNDSLYPKNVEEKGIVDELLNFDIPVVFGLSHVVDEESVEQIEKAFDMLNILLINRKYVAGKNLTIADFSISISVGLAEIFDFDIVRYDNVVGWFERCKEALRKYGYDEINAPALQMGNWFRANLQTA